MNVAGSSFKLLIKSISSTNASQKNQMMLCFYQHTSMVNWSDKNHFASGNYNSLSTYSILKQLG